MSHIFISYSKKNRDYTRQLADHLLEQGFDVWMDDRIDYGENWERVIFQAIDDCAAFIVVMTPQSYDSTWVQRECHHAEKRGKPPFPVLLDGVEEFPRYGLTQYVDVRGGALPPDDFSIRLAQYAPRHLERGADIIQTQEMKALRVKAVNPDPETPAVSAPQPEPFQGQVAPPLIDIQKTVRVERPTKTAPNSTKSRVPFTILGTVFAVILLMGIYAVYVLSNQKQDEVADYAAQGWNEYNDEKYRDAIDSFSKAIEQDPENTLLYLGRGNAYFYDEQHQEAMNDYGIIFENAPDNPAYVEAYINGGLIYDAWGMFPEADAALHTALNLDSSHYESYRYLGDLYYRQQNYTTALEKYEMYVSVGGEVDSDLENRLKDLGASGY